MVSAEEFDPERSDAMGKVGKYFDLSEDVAEALRTAAFKRRVSQLEIVERALRRELGMVTTFVEVAELIEEKADYPVRDEHYTVGRTEDGRYFFAWGPEYPHADEIPAHDIEDGESGIHFHNTPESALGDMRDAIDAAESAECAYCGALVYEHAAPDVRDDEEWERVAKEHRPGCEWIETRAHRVRV